MDSSGLEAIPTSVLYSAPSSVRLSVKRHIQTCLSSLSLNLSVLPSLPLSPITQGQVDQASL